MHFVTISDTHNRQNAFPKFKVPDGDVLIHCGDLTMGGSKEEIEKAADWLGGMPHKYKIVVPGNHDFLFEEDPVYATKIMKDRGITTLIDSGRVIDYVSVWGTPYQPWFLNWAFNVADERERRKHYDKIPNSVDVLVTHTPPYKILDEVPMGEHVGCNEMLTAVLRTRPKYHLFGHIHHSYGVQHFDGITFANTSCCNERYWLVNQAFGFDL